MTKKVSIITFLAIAVSLTNYAQTNIDTLYIKKYNQKWLVQGYVGINSIQIENYNSNFPLNIGVGVAIKNTIVNLKLGYGILPLRSKEFGKTKVIDMQMHNYGKNFVFDIFLQQYKGFYESNLNSELLAVHPDLSILQLGIEGAYIFNGNQFSTKAAFNQSEIQLKSSGSWVLGSGIFYYNLKNYPTLKLINSIKNVQISLNGGYGYSWILNKNWYLSSMVTLGPVFGKEINDNEKVKLKVYPAAFARMAATYHRENWSIGFSALIQNKMVFHSQNNSIDLASYCMQLSIVKHLDNLL